ncbi:uncharacterized protein PRCAT00002650001 [Priceomyces carsonii]|uniref:uncharacterized protein n=1 Tax=Priceomyces carsonii TaxID=28549 RepID=UPI002ED923F1|nr:unnamed protein product [Priceomyces carsonii]
MAESETSSTSETSDSTIEPFLFQAVLQGLNSAANDVTESDDYLSFSTVLDIYLNDPSKYSYEEREILLDEVLKVLNEHKALTYEIGWDIPSLLIPYVDSNFQFNLAIRDAPCVYKIIKIFECLALYGNPKELFLQSCELLSKISVNDSTVADDIKEMFFDIKLYCVFELINSCLKKIRTLYPSRFLAMTVSSFINSHYKNSDLVSGDSNFILTRAYTFLRDYSSPPVPDDTKGLSDKELAKIREDENYLQRKLLTGFLTETISLHEKRHLFGFSFDHVSYLRLLNGIDDEKNYKIEHAVLDRFLELAYSFDLSLSKTFKEYLINSHELLHTINYNSRDEDSISAEVFEKVIIDYQKNVASSLIDSDANEIKDSVIGRLILFTYQIAKERSFDKIELGFRDALAFTIRSLIPGLVLSSFRQRGLQDTAVFWSWYSLHQLSLNNKKIELEIEAVPKELLIIYYQILLFCCISSKPQSNFRYCTLTLLSRVLSLSPEDTAYSFIQDSLLNCPYDAVKSDLVGILKQMLTKEKVNVAELEQNLSSLGISSSSQENEQSLNIKQKEPKKYFSLDETKAKDILELLDSAIDTTFLEIETEEEENSKSSSLLINPGTFGLLSSYLNLLVVIKDNENLSKQENKLLALLDKVTTNTLTLKDQLEQSGKTSSFEYNATGILGVAIERITNKNKSKA